MNISDKIKELNPVDVPVAQTDVWKWMDAGNFQYSAREMRRAYLEEKGFVIGQDTLDLDVVATLRTIINWYSERKVRGY